MALPRKEGELGRTVCCHDGELSKGVLLTIEEKTRKTKLSDLIVLFNTLRNLHSGAVERIKRMMMIYNILMTVTLLLDTFKY